MVGITSGLWAQAPAGAGAGAAGAAGAGAAGAGAAPAAAPAPASIWSFLGINKTCLKEFKVRLCKSNIGLMMGNMLKPVSLMSGGLLPQCCPKVLQDDALAKAAKEGPDAAKGDAAAAAAKIAQDEAQAKERRAAVRYLGTVDCHYWGDVAIPALIAALRGDPNECVRWEAAMALGSGCCCNKQTIAALTLSVYGVDDPAEGRTVAGAFVDGQRVVIFDKHPVETSERVKASALAALQHCLSCYSEVTTPGPERGPEPAPEKKTAQGKVAFQPAVYSKPGVEPQTLVQMVQTARQITTTPTSVSVPASAPANINSHTLAGVFSRAFGSSSSQMDGSAVSADAPPMAAPSPRYSGLLPWLTR
jgi:hypothetical protein